MNRERYSSKRLFTHREAIFWVNVAKISQLNKRNVDFKLAIQKFADFTEIELKKLMTGLTINLFPETQPYSENSTIPTSYGELDSTKAIVFSLFMSC